MITLYLDEISLSFLQFFLQLFTVTKFFSIHIYTCKIHREFLFFSFYYLQDSRIIGSFVVNLTSVRAPIVLGSGFKYLST